MRLENSRELSPDSLVWYAAYGSNLRRDRLMCYLEGRAPTPNARVPRRCVHGTEIHGDRPFRLAVELYFARESPSWDHGGVAFVGLQHVTPPPTLGRAYLLTLDQLRHVAVEENGGLGSVSITRENLRGAAVNIRDRGWYRVLLPCGLLNRRPVVTLTGRPEETVPRRRPSEIYLETIRAGLRETYPGVSDSHINEYLQQVSEPGST